MRGMSMLQMVGGVAVAGIVAAGSTALTGSGLTLTPTANKFVGGYVEQNIVGATVDTIGYTYADNAKTEIDTITIGITGAAAKVFTMAATGSGLGGGATRWLCDDGTNHGDSTFTVSGLASPSTSATIVCSALDGTTNPGYYTGMTKLTITVA